MLPEEQLESDPRPFNELSSSGLLWLINRVVFHPQGLSLALWGEREGVVSGWNLLGYGDEINTFPIEIDAEYFRRAQQTIREHIGLSGCEPNTNKE